MTPSSPGEWLRRAAAGEGLPAEARAALARWLVAQPGQAEVFGLTQAAAADVVEARLRWLPAACAAAAAGPLEVAGYAEQVALPPEDVFRFHLPLARLLLGRAREAGGRLLVAVAGVPGSGKSVFTALMARVLRALEPPFGIAAAGLDGYHYSNAYLLAHRTPEGVAEAGPLKLYKGACFTFDTVRLVADLRRLRSVAAPVWLPAYDRTLHDPVEGRIRVGTDDRLVLVEGNYLLCREPGWERVPDLFALRLFLDVPPDGNRKSLLERHVRGGRTREDAERHFERVDRPNTELVQATRREAHLVVALDADYRVRGLEAGPCRRMGQAAGLSCP